MEIAQLVSVTRDGRGQRSSRAPRHTPLNAVVTASHDEMRGRQSDARHTLVGSIRRPSRVQVGLSAGRPLSGALGDPKGRASAQSREVPSAEQVHALAQVVSKGRPPS